jgi:hypothetical protein
MARNIIYILIFMLLATACSKMNPGDCFKSTGEVTTEARDASAFRFLHIYNNVDVFLSYGAEYSIEVHAGKNIMNGIKTRIDDNTLSIKNENTCNWVRSYEKPLEVYITTPTLDSIVYQASGNLTSTNQFSTDSLKLDVLEGAGTIDLNVNASRSTYNLHYGTVDLNVRGYSHISYLYSGGYGPANLRNLRTVYTYLTNNSTNNCFVWSTLSLDVKIENVGDVYYWGDPQIVNFSGTGSGKLIKR